MIFCLALLLGGPDPDPWDPYRADGTEVFTRLRTGVWAGNSLSFKAVSGSVQREIDTHILGSAGADIGLTFGEHVFCFGSYEISAAQHLFSDVAGACVGWRQGAEKDTDPWVPRETALYAGGLWGRFDVADAGFGEFSDAFGFRAGISFSWDLGKRTAVCAVGEYRLITFHYEEDTTLGANDVGGSTAWLGLALEVRW
jgi:hypothetical protein